jgi:hypothetical protein
MRRRRRNVRRTVASWLDQPESVGALAAIFQLTSDPGDTWVIDFRSKRGGYSSGLPADGVMVRHSNFDPSWGANVGYLEWQPEPFMLPGDTFTDRNFSMHVVSIDGPNGATVQVTY